MLFKTHPSKFYSLPHTQKSSIPPIQAFTTLLKLCSSSPYQLKQIHALLLTTGLSIKNRLITHLLTNLTLLGHMSYARQLFDEMHKPRTFLWNTLIKGYVKNELPIEAASVYRQMHLIGVRPDSFTYPFVVKACAQLPELWTGGAVHVHVMKYGLEFVSMVRTELMIMYVKFGEMGLAEFLFESMVERDVVAWNALIAVCVQNGLASKALGLFHQMSLAGIKPDAVTIVSALSACGQLGVLSACSHAGLVNEGWAYFNHMAQSGHKNIQPRKEHYACMVDLLGRSGHLEEAYNFIKSMPIEPDAGVWGALLGACAIHHDVKLGQHVADLLFEVAPDIASYHVIMSNMYAAVGRWDFVDKVRLKMRKKGIKKVAGYSSVEFNSEFHFFYGGDRSHPQSAYIYEKLEVLLEQIKSIGYIPKTSSVFHDVETEEKEVTISTHSEKLAIAFGLINVRPEYPIRASLGTGVPSEMMSSIEIKSIGYIPKTSSVFHDVETEEKEVTISTHSEKLAIAFGLINVRPEYPIRASLGTGVPSEMMSSIEELLYLQSDQKDFSDINK
ncbi:pentatricopeptide repeat-containing protein [Quercus suber]|uniref:Pentatricopeptide repeat-containing protein n=1 Tax=Quercus suber TaxID=58331 RepID=A0AAW0JNL2_QUESU